MITIWGRADSANVKKVLWTAQELGLDYRLIEAGGRHGLIDTDDYRRLNPMGLVPTLQDEAGVLWESNAIVRYLAARYGEGRLHHPDPRVRAQAEMWMDWVSSAFIAPYRDVFWNQVRRSASERDEAALEAGRLRCAALLEMVDQALAQAPFLSGEALGVGDIALGPFAYGWFEMPIERLALPRLEAWYARLRDRPAFARTIAIPLT